MAGTGGTSNQDGVVLRDRSRTGPAPDTKSDNSSSPGGTVERVALTMPAEFTVAGSPITKDGTLAVMRNPAAANTVLAGPVSGSDATPAMRALQLGDLPDGASGSWTPVFTFTTPGDISVTYSFQFGTYLRIGNWVFLRYTMVFTPTYSSASGGNRITGFPFAFNNAAYFAQPIFNTISYPAGRLQALIQGLNGTTTARVGSQGDGASFAEWSTTQFPSGVSRNLQSSLVYLTS